MTKESYGGLIEEGHQSVAGETLSEPEFTGPDTEELAGEKENGKLRGQAENKSAEERYMAADLDEKNDQVQLFDVSDEALAELSPAERKRRRYALAASFFHEADRRMQIEGVSDRVKELRQKAHDLYEEADQKEKEGEDQIIPIAGEAHSAEKIPVTLAGASMNELASRTSIDAAAEAIKKKFGPVDGFGNPIGRSAPEKTQRGNPVLRRGYVPGAVAEPQPTPVRKGFWSRVGSWFKK